MRTGIRLGLASARIGKAFLLGVVTIAMVIPGGDVAMSQSGTGPTFTFTVFDYPSQLCSREHATVAYGINIAGQIAGIYFDASCNWHSFSKDGATYTSINGSNSFAYGINDAGQIVVEQNGQGFLTDVKGTSITSFACNFSNETVPTGINSKGQIVGWLFDTNTNSTRAFVTNVNALASCSPFDFPGSTATEAWGINGKGETVGVFWNANGVHGFFINAAGQHFQIDIPGSTQTQAFGVNDAGQIVGTYTDAATFSSYGFLLANATALTSFTKIDVPNSGGSTNVNGINNTGQIVGSFQDLTTPITTFHAFVGKTSPVLMVPKWFQGGIPVYQNGDPVPGDGFPGNFWGPKRYDFETPEFTIYQKGCALTALTMVLNFLIGNFTTPTLSSPNTGVPPADPKNPMNPSMPNGWKGLFTLPNPPTGDPGGDIKWNDFAPFAQTQLLVRVYQKAANNGFPVFYQDSAQKVPDPNQTMDNILRNGVPVILPILNSSGKFIHFVVITGKDSKHNTYFVNDPGAAWDLNLKPVKTLLDLPNTQWYKNDTPNLDLSLLSIPHWIVFARVDKVLKPMDPNTPQALGIYSSDPVEFVLTDPQGRRTGFDPVTNTLFQDIPASDYSTTVYKDEQNFSSASPPFKALDMANQMAGQYSLDVIGTGSGAFAVEVTASDAAGNWITHTYSGTTAPGASSQFTFQGAVTTFAAFSAHVGINNSKNQFAVGGQFTLGAGSAGIDPLTQPVTLQVDAFSITIPAGSFRRDSFGSYVFQGTINGVQLAAGIQPQGGNNFAYGVAGQNANNLPTASPVDVRLAIGSNGGDVSVNANFTQ